MNLDLSPETEDLRQLVRAVASTLADRPPAERWSTLAAVGALDVLGPDGVDPDQANVLATLVLAELAGSGVRAPFAETMWARATVPDAAPDGFVTAPAPAAAHGPERLVPHLEAATAVAVGRSGGDVTLVGVADLGPVRPADTIVTAGHAWVALDPAAAAFVELAPAFAWRTGAAQTVGALDVALRRAVTHAKGRVQFGRPIASFQALQFRLAESFWRLHGLRLAVLEASWRADRGDARADALSAMAWILALDVGRTVTRHVHQVFGAIGFSDELGISRLTGDLAFLRLTRPEAAATRVVVDARRPAPPGVEPPSTVLAGFGASA